ncbi:ATP-dependent RNA helicase DOB1 [Striga asiatica]|uniref:ATP-dependent RNA helicase DOB1 n=1 Tax=Striga asiatica TaxID=4170 RepID=A0A5A7PH11_STRAF|nr:ATP-dependent RNA helicase DOB1 [Striga asiatica]
MNRGMFREEKEVAQTSHATLYDEIFFFATPRQPAAREKSSVLMVPQLRQVFITGSFSSAMMESLKSWILLIFYQIFSLQKRISSVSSILQSLVAASMASSLMLQD